MKASKPSQSAGPLLLANIGQLLTLRAPGKPGPRRAHELNDVGIVEDAAILCDGGKILAAGKARDVLRHPVRKKLKGIAEFDCNGKVVLPGFVDSHTHLVFAAPRLLDFEKRISGATYEEIALAGGGIVSSVEAVRKAQPKTLVQRAVAALHEMAAHGTATVEAKSGYGLSLKAEIESLEVIQQAAREWQGTVVSTLLGAHAVPKEFQKKRERYLREVCEKMIPTASKRKLAVFVDIFYERGAFTLEDCERVFEAATKHGLGVRAHVCQFSSGEIWPLLRSHPASLDHMDLVNSEDIAQLARRDTIATLLPGSNYFLGLGKFPPARTLIDAGVPVALATDYNPGTSPTSNMQFILSLACTQMKMTPAEAIAAATINGAYALKLSDRKGTLEPGKDADVAVFEVDDYREIAYWFGGTRCLNAILHGHLRD